MTGQRLGNDCVSFFGLPERRMRCCTLTQEEQEQARLILADLCVSSPTESPTDTPVSQEAETTKILGIEFRKADPDSKGHDRLKK